MNQKMLKKKKQKEEEEEEVKYKCKKIVLSLAKNVRLHEIRSAPTQKIVVLTIITKRAAHKRTTTNNKKYLFCFIKEAEVVFSWKLKEWVWIYVSVQPKYDEVDEDREREIVYCTNGYNGSFVQRNKKKEEWKWLMNKPSDQFSNLPTAHIRIPIESSSPAQKNTRFIFAFTCSYVVCLLFGSSTQKWLWF